MLIVLSIQISLLPFVIQVDDFFNVNLLAQIAARMFKPANVDAYIAAFSPDVQEKMHQLRAIIRKHAPYAIETLNYRIPAYKQDGAMVVYFAIEKNCLALYPGEACLETFRNDLAPYKCVKGAIQFPFDRKLPLQLLTRMIKHRVQELSRLRLGKRK